MVKAGRNDPCPCGSGKKYKNCHWSEDQSAPVKHQARPEPKSPLELLLKRYHPEPIVKLIGALQLSPENHAQGAALEELARLTLLQRRRNDTRPFAPWNTLAALFASMGYRNDEPTNSFTENAIFTEGNYIVYPGIYAGVTNIVNELLEALFLKENKLPDAFIKSVHDGAGIMLFISNSVAEDAGHTRYMQPPVAQANIQVVGYEAAMENLRAISFPKKYLQDVCRLHHYEYAILQEFILPVADPELHNDNPDENPVSKKPLMETEEEIILFMPSTVVNSVMEFIYRKARQHGCYKEILALLCQHQFQNACAALGKMRWAATDIVLPPKNSALPIREMVFQFDTQKFGYLCFIETPGSKLADLATVNLLEERNEEAVNYLSRISAKQTYQVLTLFVTAETGQEGLFSWQKPSAGNQTIAFQYREFLALAYAKTTNRLSLWKFAKAYTRTSEKMKIMSMSGTLDAYAIYDQNNGSLLHSDEANPIGGMMMIVPGSSNDFQREVQRKRDEHAVMIFNGEVAGYTKVIREKEFAPIYTDKFVHTEHRRVIENFKLPIWITNYQSTNPNDETWAHHLCEAVAFWFQKMEDDLHPLLEPLSLVQLEVEIVVDEKLLKAEQFEIKDIDLSSVSIDIKIEAPRIKLFIPFDFLYVVRLSDNSADKVLMKAALKGISVYATEAKNSIDLDGVRIDEIVENSLRPSGAKMLLFSDASQDVRRDNRGLPAVRYIQEADVSYVLDNLVSYLPPGYVIPETIATVDEKIKLCDDLVTAIIEQIRARIARFDGEELIKWLIRANEKCIQVREMREIHIPAKIACFSSFETEVHDLLEKGENLVTTSHALRTLIEWVAIAVPSGTKWPNDDDIDEMLALTNQLINWGASSEAMRFGLANPQMGLLPSGRIGTEKTMEKQVLEPYGKSKTESDIFKYVEKFEKNYRQKDFGQATPTAETEKLDEAFEAEFGITLTRLSQIIGALINEGFKIAEACVKIEEGVLKEIIRVSVAGITEIEIDTALQLLTLLQRPSIGRPPKGYFNSDIFPWRYTRSLSYLRRPLVRHHLDDQVMYYFGYRHLMAYIDNLYFLLFTGKLPENKSEKMRSWIGATLDEKGKPYRNSVKDWLKGHTSLEVIDFEVSMKPSGHLPADKDYGDIDVMAIDHVERIIYSIECKNNIGARNIHEMKGEMDLYLGRDESDKKAKIKKHVKRHEWLLKNRVALSKFVTNPETYQIKSFVLTADEMPLPFIKGKQLPLQILSFVALRKDGITALKNL